MTAVAQSQQQQQQQQQQIPPAVQYREILQECDQLARRIAEFEVDRNEHILVEETLKPLDGSRRAYRLVGDVLVERSVQEVLPSVTSNRENLEATIKALRDRLESRQKEGAELKAKYNIG